MQSQKVWGKRMGLLALLASFTMAGVAPLSLPSSAWGASRSEECASEFAKGDRTPRKVKKDGNVDVPSGMHLVRDRTGARWLLPEGMSTPPSRSIRPKYFKRSRAQKGEPETIGRIGSHEVLDRPLNAEACFVEDSKGFWSALPKKFRELIQKEKEMNLHAFESAELQGLGRFSPTSQEAFYLPYIPIPESEFEFARVADFANADTSALVSFTKGGKRYYRFFVHPNYVDKYGKLIEKHGIVYHYLASTTSSPRSLIVIDPAKKGKVYWVKPSLHKQLDGSVRINSDKKVRRAVMMSEALSNIPASSRKDYGVDFMLEPASFLPAAPRGTRYGGTIVREVHSSLLQPSRGKTWIPGLVLTAPDRQGMTVLEAMISKSRQDPESFVREKIIKPLLMAYFYVGFKEGLPGELHVQNFYYELNSKGLPTGKVLLKDNDGFRFDVELALRRGRKLKQFSEYDHPFDWAKFSNAIGKGAENRPFIGSWYYKLIRNRNGFETLASYTLSVLQSVQPSSRWSKSRIQDLFDEVASELIEEITGQPVVDFGYGAHQGINRALHEYRARLSIMAAEPEDAPDCQSELKSLFDQAVKEDRAYLMGSKRRGPKTYYLVHRMSDGSLMIEARVPLSKRGKYPNPTVGFAILEPGTKVSSAVTRAGNAQRNRMAKEMKANQL